MSFHCLLAFIVPDEKSAVDPVGVLCVMSHISLAALKLLSLNVFTLLCLGVDFFELILLRVCRAT